MVWLVPSLSSSLYFSFSLIEFYICSWFCIMYQRCSTTCLDTTVDPWINFLYWILQIVQFPHHVLSISLMDKYERLLIAWTVKHLYDDIDMCPDNFNTSQQESLHLAGSGYLLSPHLWSIYSKFLFYIKLPLILQSRKLQENGWKPRWFRREGENGSFRYVGGYWEAREQLKWDECPNIFGEFCEDVHNSEDSWSYEGSYFLTWTLLFCV